VTARDIPFDDLGDAKLASLAALRTETEDPNGLIRFTLGPDGRLLTLFIDDAVPRRLTHLALEQKLNEMFEAANAAAWQSRKQVIDSL
jgi:hypothetical protein